MEERRKSKDLKITYLLDWLNCFSCRLDWHVSREDLLELGAGKTPWMGKKAGGEVLCDQLEMEAERRACHSCCLLHS